MTKQQKEWHMPIALDVYLEIDIPNFWLVLPNQVPSLKALLPYWMRDLKSEFSLQVLLTPRVPQGVLGAMAQSHALPVSPSSNSLDTCVMQVVPAYRWLTLPMMRLRASYITAMVARRTRLQSRVVATVWGQLGWAMYRYMVWVEGYHPKRWESL